MSRIEEIKERLQAATPGPWWQKTCQPCAERGCSDIQVWDQTGNHLIAQWTDAPYEPSDGDLIANAPADLAYLLAELEKTRRAARTLGKIVDRQCIDVLNATGMHHVIDEDGDGDWEVVWERLAEMRTELSQAQAKLNQEQS